MPGMLDWEGSLLRSTCAAFRYGPAVGDDETIRQIEVRRYEGAARPNSADAKD